eukprot:s1326_g9.t1
MDTLPMPETWWDDDVSDAIVLDAINNEGKFQDSELPPCDEEDVEEIPPTQPETEDMEGDGYMGEEAKGGTEEKVSGEGEEGGTETSSISQDFPMVTREEQQAFKEAKGRVSKMDQANQVPDSEKNKPAQKRNTSRSTNPLPKKAKESKKDKKGKPTAEPVNTQKPEEVEPVETDTEDDELPRENLETKFNTVANDLPRSDVAEPSSTPKPSRRGKGKGKAKSKAKTSPAKASTKPPSPKLKRRTAAKSRAHAKAKVQEQVGKGDKAEDKGPGEPKAGEGDDGGKKKTFAGRYSPKGEVLWWDFAFKFLKQEDSNHTLEHYTVIAEGHVPAFLARDDVRS